MALTSFYFIPFPHIMEFGNPWPTCWPGVIAWLSLISGA